MNAGDFGTLAGCLQVLIAELKDSEDCMTRSYIGNVIEVLREKGLDPEDILGSSEAKE